MNFKNNNNNSIYQSLMQSRNNQFDNETLLNRKR